MLLLDQQPGPSAYFQQRYACWFMKAKLIVSGQSPDVPLKFVEMDNNCMGISTEVLHVGGRPVFDMGYAIADTYNVWFSRRDQAEGRPQQLLEQVQRSVLLNNQTRTVTLVWTGRWTQTRWWR